MAFRFKRAHDRAGISEVATDQVLAAEIDVVERVRARYPQGTRLSFGAPTKCPRCSEYGLVEDVQLIAGRAANRCLRCDSAWTITVRALLAVDRRRPLRVAGWSTSLAALRRRRALEARLAPAPDLEGVRFSRSGGGTVVRAPVSAATRPLRPSPRTDRPPTAEGAPHWKAPPLPLRVLLVEDDPDEVQTVRSLIEPAAGAIDLRTATTRAAGEVVARVSPPDLVLLDLSLPDSHGMATLTYWHEWAGDAPVLVVSGEYESELADRSEELGVTVVDKAALARYLEQGAEGTTAFLDLLGASSTPEP
jgi:CheY-like chemotaxis protein